MARLRYVGWGDTTGYGIAAASMVRALDSEGYEVAWEPMVSGPSLALGYEPDRSGVAGPADLVRLRDDGRRCAGVLLHTVPEYYPFYIARERAAGGGDVAIWGYTIWETDRIPAHWPALINGLDGVIVPSDWNKDTFRRCGITIPIAVVPHLPQFAGASANPAARETLAAKLPDLTGRMVFYTIGHWMERKGFAPLLAAFMAAFKQTDPVALVIKTTAFDQERQGRSWRSPFRPAPLSTRRQLRRLLAKASRPPPPVVLLSDALPEEEILALHERGDCYASLCRAEGWGLGAFEAAWLGKPVIMTGWGGQRAFLKPDTSHLVAWRLTPVRTPRPNASYTADQNWAEPDVASATSAMRAVFDHRDDARRMGHRLSADVRARFNPAVATEKLMRAIWPLS